MWPKILKEAERFEEIRNYARSGASYKTQTRTAGNERQNVQYQIDVAMNDLDNPNNVFSVDDFVPDIVIFALGTNDGAPNDTYDSAMNATVYTGTTIDTTATMAALDDTNTIASARKAFMRVKQAFPMAQIYCVLPIQRADNDTNLGTLREYLKQMAQRYGCIIVDGTFDSGITREFNVSGGLGMYLKDGLHPNEKGQNLMARMIIASLKSHYVPFGAGFNN
jgi:lysophospholipase L1-like esterase